MEADADALVIIDALDGSAACDEFMFSLSAESLVPVKATAVARIMMDNSNAAKVPLRFSDSLSPRLRIMQLLFRIFANQRFQTR